MPGEGLANVKGGQIPEWGWVVLAVLGILALALWLRRKLDRAPMVGPQVVP